MTTVTTAAAIRINNGPPVAGELVVENQVETVQSLSPKPDPNWSTVDDAGHYHAYAQDQTGGQPPYPTLTPRTRHHDCDGIHLAPTMDDGCEGWDETYYVCPICDEQIRPGQLAGPHETRIAGRLDWRVTANVPPLEIDTTVTVRITTGDREHFGLAVVTAWTSHLDPSHGAATLTAAGPLGHRTARHG